LLHQTRGVNFSISKGGAATEASDFAEKYSKGNLSAAQSTMLGLAERQYRLTQKLMRLAAQGKDTRAPMIKLAQAQALVEKGQFAPAKSIFDQLEKQFGR
jgi:hypothetical protein